MTLKKILEEEFFPFVIRPARYRGNEWGSQDYSTAYLKPPDKRVALVVPDKYDRGICLPELHLCYNFFRSQNSIQCERVFAPDYDAEAILRSKNLPLFSLESLLPLTEFDELIFLIPSELNLTAVLNILELGKLPLAAAERHNSRTRVYALPVGLVNLSAVATLFDQIVTGDIVSWLEQRIAQPALQPEGITPVANGWEKLKQDFQFVHSPIIPYEEVLHDRLTVLLPHSFKPETFARQISDQLAASGFEEFAIEGDVLKFGEDFVALVRALGQRLQNAGVRCLLPPLPPNLLSLDHFDKLAFGRRRSLRFYLGAGSEYLREALGLFFDIDTFFELLANAFARNWRSLRLYFEVGLPEESDSDLEEIAEIVSTAEELGFEYGEKHSIQVTLTPFIPRPFTKWQWDAILPAAELNRRVDFVKARVKKRNVQFRSPSIDMAVLEGLLARGGDAMLPVIRSAHSSGARFDSWQEHFDNETWQAAIAASEIDLTQIATAQGIERELFEPGEGFGISTRQLRQQRESAFPAERKKPRGGFTLGDIVLAKPEVAEQILAPRSEEKRSFGRKPKRVTQTSTAMAVPRSRVRLQWRKGEEVRHVGHLACMKMFERAIRRARIPVEYTQGQQPRQKVSLGPPLALGYTSDAEYFDLHLEQPYQEEFLHRLNQELPAGFAVVQARPVFGKVSSVASQINMACYDVDLNESADISPDRAEEILNKESIVIVRKRGEDTKEVDVRPAILDLHLDESDSGSKRLEMALGLGNLGFVRPDEVLSQCLYFDEDKVLTLKIHRRALFVVQGERRLSPFEVS